MNEIEIFECIETLVKVFPSFHDRLSRLGKARLKYLPYLRARVAAKKIEDMLKEHKFPAEFIMNEDVFKDYLSPIPDIIRCADCKYWSIKGFGVAICLHDPKIITTKEGDRNRVYPPTMSSYTCEFAESK